MRKVVTALFQHQRVITENSNEARQLHRSHFGTKMSDGRISLAATEALYLLESERLHVVDGNNKRLSFGQLLRKLKLGKDAWISYVVFRDLRDNGYIVKTGTKYGGEFRVYEPGEEHSTWIVSPVRARENVSWQAFSAKNRVAHSTAKKLLVAVVDEEDDVTYWEISWLRP
jgi:tRNA-intron endonuclease